MAEIPSALAVQESMMWHLYWQSPVLWVLKRNIPPYLSVGCSCRNSPQAKLSLLCPPRWRTLTYIDGLSLPLRTKGNSIQYPVIYHMLLEISGEIIPERMKGWSQSKNNLDVTGNRSKVRCCKEQYCIGTWNVRSMNQGKLQRVKQ